MAYYIHMNDSRLTLIPGRFIALTDDNTKKVLMRVSFEVEGTGVVCMTTSQELTYMSAGNEKSVEAGGKIVFGLDHVIVLCTESEYTPRYEVRVVKMTAPMKGEEAAEAVLDAPPKLAQKRQKRQKREFHMLS